MREFRYGLIWSGVAYFIVLVCIALFVRDIPHQPESFAVTLAELIKVSRMGDPGSFATAAIDIAENGWISDTNDWILNLWPPGFILLEAAIVKVLGPDVPVVLVLQILAALLFSFVLVLLFDLLRTTMHHVIAFLLPLLIFAFPVSRVFLLQPTGISLGESFAIGFFLLFVLQAIRAVARSSLHAAVYAGLCLALSAYFRSQFEIILGILTGFGILLAASVHTTRLREQIGPGPARSAIRTIVVVLLVAHAATMPWRAYHWIKEGSPAWVFTSGLAFSNSVMTSEQLISKNGGFVVAGGGNLVCRIDPETCGDTANAKKAFVRTFITHPVEWYSIKLGLLGEYWFSPVNNWAHVHKPASHMDLVVNGLLLVMLLAIITLSFTRKARSWNFWIVYLWVNISLFSVYFLIITAAHFEVRYFHFAKVAVIFMALLIAGMHSGQRETSARDGDFSGHTQ